MPPLSASREELNGLMKRAVVALVLLLALCTIDPPSTQARGALGRAALPGDHLVVSQDDQVMYVYEAGSLVRVLPVSTGWPGARPSITPVFEGFVGGYWGTFESYGAIHDFGYYLFTDYLAESGETWNLPGSGAWNGDVLVHGAPYLYGWDGEKQYDLSGIGYAPVSHGCIRLLPEDAAWLHRWNPTGVAITILWFGE